MTATAGAQTLRECACEGGAALDRFMAILVTELAVAASAAVIEVRRRISPEDGREHRANAPAPESRRDGVPRRSRHHRNAYGRATKCAGGIAADTQGIERQA